jgi:ADP-L-glycero-D-manno-heptose 6-epimerase
VIIVTGGAGFIGSNVVKALNERGVDDALIVDRLGTGEKWKNLVGLRFSDFEHKDHFIAKVERGLFDREVTAIVHMGACSSTVERDADYLYTNNFLYTRRLAEHFGPLERVRFIYASSAAVYGDGARGYSDEDALTPELKPLNMYGFSKLAFDVWALRTGFSQRSVGLRFFNVFGPNEHHKGDMRSVAVRAYHQARKEGRAKLFKSYKPEFRDGEQLRDFVYIKDTVKTVLFFLDNPRVNGVYNVGTGEPRNFNDLVKAVFNALGIETRIEYIDMPEGLEKRYQYITSADLSKLRSAGYREKFMRLEDAVSDYVRNHLMRESVTE